MAGVLVMSWLALYGFAWSDYDNEASAAFRALSEGDLTGFFSQVPAYGGSLVLRAPFAGITAALGGGDVAVFRAVSIPCIVALAVFGVLLVRRMGARGASTGARALVLGLCVLNPITVHALEIGHPEELLCAALAIGAVLAAIDDRPVPATLLLGLAIATKMWAVLAIGPVLLALPGRRLLVLAGAGAVTVAVLAPIMLIGDGTTTLVKGASTTSNIFVPWQIFWFLGEGGHVVIGGNGLPKPDGYRVPPEWLSPLTHPFIAFLVVPLSLAWARVQRAVPRFGGEQILLLLALLLLLRCIFDPWNVVYYELPFLIALLTWEALCRSERPPVMTLAAVALTWVTFQRAPDFLSPDMQCVFFLGWSVPLAAWLARTAFWPARARAPHAALEPAPRPLAAAQQG